MTVTQRQPRLPNRHSQLLTKRLRLPSFTLVELLVVIVIITILASMLLPALGRSRYTAKLTVDRSNLRQLGMSMLTYSGDADSWYPYRRVNSHNEGSPMHVVKDNIDDRLLYADYISFDHVRCPLTPAQPAGYSLLSSYDSRQMWYTYELWAGSMIDHGVSASRMYRTGDRPQYNGREFDVLACDIERTRHLDLWHQGSHPDRASLLDPIVQSTPASSVAPRWRRRSGLPLRGDIDRSFLHDDGSVRTLYGIVHRDPRLQQLPSLPGLPTGIYQNWLPAAD
jgi:type II secretory pathway pseudopilin PulG